MQELLKHFHKLSIHPNNAQQLKGLILQLAIQGKLTSEWRRNNPSLISGNNSAQKELERFKEEKSFSIIEKKKRKEKPLPLINEDNIPFELPENWIWSYLGDLGFTNVGLTYKPSHKVDDGVPVLRSSNIQNGKIDFSDLVRVNTDYRAKDLIEEGDLLICARNGSKRLVGKCAIIEELKEITVFGAFMAIFRSDFNNYIKLFIESPIFRNRLEGVSTTTINQITQGNLKSTFIPFPPISEQHKIIKVVETLFKEVEALENLTEKRIELKKDYATSALSQLAKNDSKTEWQALKPQFHTFFNEVDNIKKLRETILQLAVQGKLTAKWRAQNSELISGENSAENLLKEVKTVKSKLIKEKKIKKEKALPPISEDEIPFELPEGWVWCRLGEVSKKLGAGSTPSGGKSAYVDEGIMFFRSQNIYNHYLKLNPVAYITDEIHERMKNTKVRPMDILLNITGGSIGRCSLIPDDFNTANVSQHVAIVRMIDLKIRKYIHQFIISPGFQDRIMHVQVGVSREGLSMTKLKMFPTPLPPQEEQKAIVEKLNVLMTLCDKLEQKVLTGQQQIEDLMQSVIKEVFEGEKEEEQNLQIAAEKKEVYSNRSFDEIFESLNYDHEVAAVVLLTQERFGFTYGKKYVHKMFSNIDFLNEVPIFEKLQFQEHGWGMYSPILQKTLENEVFVNYRSLENNKKTLQVKSKVIPKINKWINAQENKQFVDQVQQMLTIYEQPLIDKNMNRIELLNTVLECMVVLKTDSLKAIRTKMKNWKMFEGNYNTKSEKFSENETLHMIHFIKG